MYNLTTVLIYSYKNKTDISHQTISTITDRVLDRVDEWQNRPLKVSGCFRSSEGTQDYLDLMSFIGSARKIGCNSFNAVKFAVLGQPLLAFSQGD